MIRWPNVFKLSVDAGEPVDGASGTGTATPAPGVRDSAGPSQLARGPLLRKAVKRIVVSLANALLIGALPAALLIFAVDALLEMAETPSWVRQLTVAALTGACLAVILHAGVSRAGVRIKWKDGGLAIKVRRRS